jgi:hypothetical protein
MLASSLYVETEEDYSLSAYDLELEESNYSSSKLTDDLVELDLENIDLDNASKRGNRTTTDLVRLYLQEIGRVPLLERDEEVCEAQKVQRHIYIIYQRAKAAKKGDEPGRWWQEVAVGRHVINYSTPFGYGRATFHVESGRSYVSPLWYNDRADDFVFPMEIPAGCQ